MGRTEQSRSAPAGSLGILFVHGIGDQPRGETLRQCVEPLIDWLNAWIARGVEQSPLDRPVRLADTVLREYPGEAVPPHCTVVIAPPPTEEATREICWLAAEAWWAADFTPPTFSELCVWLITVGPWMLERQALRWEQRPRAVKKMLDQIFKESDSPNPPSLFGIGVYLVVVLSMLSLKPLAWLAALAGQVLLLALVPAAFVPQLRKGIVSLQQRLANSLGDSYVLVSSPVRFNAMVSRVQSDIRWLASQGCTSIAVIAHSQGACVAHEALRSASQPNVRLFVSYGSGLSKLHLLRRTAHLHAQLVLSGAVRGAGIALVIASFWLRWPLWGVAVFVTGSALTLFAGYILARPSDGPRPEDVPVRGLGTWLRWHDFYALDDPVPDGRPIATGVEGLIPRPISNWRSALRDHSGYWANQAEFVAPLADELAKLAGWELAPDDHDKQALAEAAASRLERGNLLGNGAFVLRLSFAIVFLALLLWEIWVGSGLLDGVGQQLGARAAAGVSIASTEFGGQFRRLLAHRPWRWACGALAVAVAWAMWEWGLLNQGWGSWDRASTKGMFARGVRSSASLLLGFGVFYLAAVSIPATFLLGVLALLTGVMITSDSWSTRLILFLLFGASAYIVCVVLLLALLYSFWPTVGLPFLPGMARASRRHEADATQRSDESPGDPSPG